ncbi:MAG: GNAT family N-acetyltransferase [Polyangiaceae bacterium]|nr:GNAT family N-acetyltransferase [Polyangiaceae bacterium]
MIAIEPARPEDFPTFLELFEELQTGDTPPTRDQFESTIRPGTLVAKREGVIVGYAFSQIFGDLCYVRHLVSAPASRRSGVGRALMGAVVERAKEAGARRWQLNVKVDNEPAIALYTSLGLRRVFETVVVRIEWASVRAIEVELPPGVRVGRVDEAQRARLEKAFALPEGLIAPSDAKVLVAAFDLRDEPLALALFVPSFPGVPTFRARAVEPALAVVAALATYAVPIEDEVRTWREQGVQIVVEDAEDVARALLARGGREHFRIVQLAGNLP